MTPERDTSDPSRVAPRALLGQIVSPMGTKAWIVLGPATGGSYCMKTFTGHPTSPLAAIKEAEDGLRADGVQHQPGTHAGARTLDPRLEHPQRGRGWALTNPPSLILPECSRPRPPRLAAMEQPGLNGETGGLASDEGHRGSGRGWAPSPWRRSPRRRRISDGRGQVARRRGVRREAAGGGSKDAGSLRYSRKILAMAAAW